MKTTLFGILLLLAAMSMNAQGVSYTYDDAGNRTARVITLAPSKSPAAPQPEAESPFSDRIAKQSIRIYPNPTEGMLAVEIQDFTTDMKAEYRLTDTGGRTITTVKAATGYQTLDLSRQAAGIYLLQITINGESVVWKIIKK